MQSEIQKRLNELRALDNGALITICQKFYHNEDIGIPTKSKLIGLILSAEFGAWEYDNFALWSKTLGGQ